MTDNWQAKHLYTETLWEAARAIAENDTNSENQQALMRFQQDFTYCLQKIEKALSDDPYDIEPLLDGLSEIASLISKQRLLGVGVLSPNADNMDTNRAVVRVVGAIRQTIENHVPDQQHANTLNIIEKKLDGVLHAIVNNGQPLSS